MSEVLTPVECGIFDAAKKLLSTLFKGATKVATLITKYGLDVTDAKESPNGGGILKVHLKALNDYGELTVDPVKDQEGYVNVKFEYDGSVEDIGVVGTQGELVSKLNTVLRDKYGITIENADIANSTKTLNVSLQRIAADDGYNINLTKVYANYDIKAAMTNLDHVLSDDSFLDLLTETPQSFEIIDLGDAEELDVELCLDFDVDNSSLSLLYSAIVLANNIKTLHWNAKGNNFYSIHERFDNFWYEANNQIDLFGELCMELNGTAPNPGIIEDVTGLIVPSGGWNEEECYQMLYDSVQSYLEILETYYVNFTSDVQSVLDDIIRYWKKEMEYKVVRELSK